MVLGLSEFTCMGRFPILSLEEEKFDFGTLIVSVIYRLVFQPLDGLNRPSK